jgi:hypothetical protein
LTSTQDGFKVSAQSAIYIGSRYNRIAYELVINELDYFILFIECGCEFLVATNLEDCDYKPVIRNLCVLKYPLTRNVFLFVDVSCETFDKLRKNQVSFPA